jgi:protoheme IX farnesyltransferase
VKSIPVRSYIELAKPRILTMVLVTAAIGYYAGAGSFTQPWTFFMLLLGTAMTSAGSGALNHYLERDVDQRMERTKRRPLPAGDVQATSVLAYGIILVLGGTLILHWQVNLLTAFLALLTAFLYVLVYTPMKRVTWLNTLIGAIPGALPPMGGWVAAQDEVGAGAWVLFAILFIWQQPHFYAIAWMFRDDYARGGFKMLPVVDPDGKSTFRQILFFSVLLLPVSILPTVMGLTGMVYGVGAIILGLWLLMSGIILARSASVIDARRVLKTSVIYLPLLLVLFVADGAF